MPHDSTGPSELQALLKERARLQADLRRLSALFHELLRSRRWRFGNAVGDLSLKLRRRTVGPNPLAEIDTILRPYKRRRTAPPGRPAADERDHRTDWLREVCALVPQLFASKRWRTGWTLSTPVRALSREDPARRVARIQALVAAGRELLSATRAPDHRHDVILTDLARELPRLLETREWRTGDRIGSLAERLTGAGGAKAVERLVTVLADYEAWRESLPGVSAARDRERIDRDWALYVENVEPQLRRRDAESGAAEASVRAVVVSWDAPPEIRDPSGGWLPAVDAFTRLDPTPKAATTGRQVEVLAYRDEHHALSLLAKRLETWPEDWVLLVGPWDSPAPDLRRALGAFLAERETQPAAVVFDHDHSTADGRRIEPALKPSFSPELLIELDYVGRAVAFRRSALESIGGFVGPLRHAVRSTLWKLFEEQAEIAKLDRTLLHVEATAERPDAPSPERAAADADVARRLLGVTETSGGARVRELPGHAEVRYPLSPTQLVSIVITFTDKPHLLRQCIESIERLTTHPRYELVLVDTRSREPETLAYLAELEQQSNVEVLRLDERFNYSRANNLGAQRAAGEHLVFLNNDTKLLTADWLEQLCGYAAQPGIGTVGAKLLFADGSLQHAGVVVGIGGFAGHVLSGRHQPFVPTNWVRHTRNCSAVTGACLAIERATFLACGGFDERLTLTGNDVELCLRLVKSGLRNVWIPTVTLFHYERSTRQSESVAEYNKRFSLFTYRELFRSGDPYFHSAFRLDTTDLALRTSAEPATSPAAQPPAKPRRDRLAGAAQYLRLYDLGQRELAANRRLVEAFRADRRIAPRSIAWFVPHFDHVYRGGIHTILRLAERFSRRCGTVNRLVFVGRGRGDLPAMDAQIARAFPEMLRELILLPPGRPEDELPEADLGICTLWTSAYHLARYNRCRGKFYMVQDFEGGFSSENSVYALAEETYRLGFIGIANTPGVCDMYRRYGSEADYFVPAVDRSVFTPAGLDLPDDVFRIVVYGRPDKPRNAFALAVESLRELKRRHGDRVEIVSVGAEFDVCEYDLEDVLVNLGLLPDLDAVASVYRSSHVGLVFMLSAHPSYQPFEYMASGCAVVTNVNEWNSWFLRDGENALVVPPLRTAVVEALESLLEDESLRRSLVEGGFASVSGIDWDEEMDAVVRFVTTGEPRQPRSWSDGTIDHGRGRQLA